MPEFFNTCQAPLDTLNCKNTHFYSFLTPPPTHPLSTHSGAPFQTGHRGAPRPHPTPREEACIGRGAPGPVARPGCRHRGVPGRGDHTRPAPRSRRARLAPPDAAGPGLVLDGFDLGPFAGGSSCWMTTVTQRRAPGTRYPTAGACSHPAPGPGLTRCRSARPPGPAGSRYCPAGSGMRPCRAAFAPRRATLGSPAALLPRQPHPGRRCADESPA